MTDSSTYCRQGLKYDCISPCPTGASHIHFSFSWNGFHTKSFYKECLEENAKKIAEEKQRAKENALYDQLHKEAQERRAQEQNEKPKEHFERLFCNCGRSMLE